MALGSYYNAMNTRQFETRVDELSEALMAGGQIQADVKALVKAQLDKMKQHVEELRTKEKAMFALFGQNGGVQITNAKELNEHLKEFNKIVFTLSGPELGAKYTNMLWEQKHVFDGLFNKAVRETIEDWTKDSKGGPMTEIHKIVMGKLNELVESLNTDKSGKVDKRHYVSSSAGWKLDSAESVKDVQPTLFTPAQKALFNKYFDQNVKSLTPAGIQYKTAISSNDDSMVFNWNVAISGKNGEPLKGSDIDELRKIDPRSTNKFVGDINSQIIEEIVGSLKPLTPRYEQLLRKCITHVLNQSHGKAFFVGKNPNEIEGMLGEIQSLFYMCAFLNRDPGDGAIWRGGVVDTETGAKPHQDILLDKYGIQVKNTTKDLLSETGGFNVSFRSKKLTSLLDELDLEPTTVRPIFENYFGTLAFNVPYRVDRRRKIGRQYYSAPASKYEPFEEALARLKKLQDQVDRLLSLFTSTIMYMDVSDSMGRQQSDRNVLYILGGTVAVTASDVLQQVIDQLSDMDKQLAGETNLHTTAPDAENSSSYNIVHVLNEMAQSREGDYKGKGIDVRGMKRLPDNSYSKQVLDQVVVSSSYVFDIQKLLKAQG